MTATASLLHQLTVDDYAREAFCIDPDSPTGFVQGGIYAGPLTSAPDAKPWHGDYVAPGDKAVTARARLVSVAAGKVFVRWAAGRTLSGGWKAAAGGVWWVTDNIADRIVNETVRRFGKRADPSIVARQFGNVGYTWTGEPGEPSYAGAPGTYKSDMAAVVVCRTTAPIKVLLGVGRPVTNPTGAAMENVVEDSEELQVVMLTSISSPKNSFDPGDKRNRRRFIGDQFLANEHFGPSANLIDWWEQAQIVARRRVARRIALRAR